MTTHHDYFKPVLVLVNDSLIETAMYLPKSGGNPFQSYLGAFFGGIVGLIAAFIAVYGWKQNQKLARENQLKAFEESVLDKIRSELTPLFVEYSDWIHSYQRLVTKLIDQNQALKAHFKNRPRDTDLISVYDQGPPALDLKDLTAFMNNLDNRQWLERLLEYSDLFKRLNSALIEIMGYHQEVLILTRMFLSEYKYADPQYDLSHAVLAKIRKELGQLGMYRSQFFRHFQYECLRNLEGIEKPVFTEPSMRYIVRDANDELKIMPPTSPKTERFQSL